MEYGPAGRRDIPGVARIFMEAFEDSLLHIFGKMPHPRLVREVLLLCLQAEREGFIVAREGNRVVGYVFAPARLSGLWGTALRKGFLYRWVFGWLKGRYRFGWQPLKILLLDKYQFLRSTVTERDYGDARILSIAVAVAARGKGVATGLMERAFDYLLERGVKRVRLEVRPWNLPALKLYHNLGFQCRDTMSDSRGEWLVMVREFSPENDIRLEGER